MEKSQYWGEEKRIYLCNRASKPDALKKPLLKFAFAASVNRAAKLRMKRKNLEVGPDSEDSRNLRAQRRQTSEQEHRRTTKNPAPWTVTDPMNGVNQRMQSPQQAGENWNSR